MSKEEQEKNVSKDINDTGAKPADLSDKDLDKVVGGRSNPIPGVDIIVKKGRDQGGWT